MIDIIATKLTMWIFSNMWFYTIIDITFLILIIVLFKKYNKLKKQMVNQTTEMSDVQKQSKKSVFDKMPTIGIPKAPPVTPIVEEEIKTEEGVFDKIISNQEANADLSNQQTQVQNNIQQPVATQAQVQSDIQQPASAQAQVQNNIQQPVAPQTQIPNETQHSFVQQTPVVEPVATAQMPNNQQVVQPQETFNYQPNNNPPVHGYDVENTVNNYSQHNEFPDYNPVDSHLSKQVVEEQPFVTASAAQERYNQSHEFKPFDASQIDHKYTQKYEDALQDKGYQNYNTQNSFEQPISNFSEPVFEESMYEKNIKVDMDSFAPSETNQFSNINKVNNNYQNVPNQSEEEIEEELKTLVQVKRHLIDKIKYYNGLIQQLELEPDGPEKAMKREEIANQLKRIKIEFEEYNEIEREVLEHAKSRTR
jgi:hypothetical protein